MVATTVTSENFQEFVTTGVVASLAIPEKEPPKVEPAKEEPKVEAKKDVDNKSADEKNADSTEETPERLQKRIDSKHRLMKEAQELAELRGKALKDAEARAEQLQKQLEALKSGSQPKDEAEPDPKDFEDPFKYAKALAKYESEKSVKADREERAKERREAEEKERAQTFGRRVADFKKITKDFDDVVSNCELILKQDGIDYLVDSDHGPALTYFLAKHEEEVERLNSYSHARRLAALGKLETQFEKTESKESAKDSVPASQSKAPAPIAVLGANGSAVEKDPSKMNTQEYLVWREQKQMEKRKH